LQAEEAKKLRKRKKAETLRLLDMERKQKQRLQEVRESQKKVPYFCLTRLVHATGIIICQPTCFNILLYVSLWYLTSFFFLQNEEEIQLKEQYRCKVRKELEDTERRYRDTPSILRVLGIPVDGCQVCPVLVDTHKPSHDGGEKVYLLVVCLLLLILYVLAYYKNKWPLSLGRP
jgi:hypothetical protein